MFSRALQLVSIDLQDLPLSDINNSTKLVRKNFSSILSNPVVILIIGLLCKAILYVFTISIPSCSCYVMTSRDLTIRIVSLPNTLEPR